MIESFKNTLADKLADIKKQYQEKEDALKKDSREDEAMFEKIKANIADIYLSVLDLSYEQVKASGGDLETLKERFVSFLDSIPQSWAASLEDANEEDDFETVYKEKAKLKAVEKIKNIFEKTAGGNNV